MGIETEDSLVEDILSSVKSSERPRSGHIRRIHREGFVASVDGLMEAKLGDVVRIEGSTAPGIVLMMGVDYAKVGLLGPGLPSKGAEVTLVSTSGPQGLALSSEEKLNLLRDFGGKATLATSAQLYDPTTNPHQHGGGGNASEGEEASLLGARLVREALPHHHTGHEGPGGVAHRASAREVEARRREGALSFPRFLNTGCVLVDLLRPLPVGGSMGVVGDPFVVQDAQLATRIAQQFVRDHTKRGSRCHAIVVGVGLSVPRLAQASRELQVDMGGTGEGLRAASPNPNMTVIAVPDAHSPVAHVASPHIALNLAEVAAEDGSHVLVVVDDLGAVCNSTLATMNALDQVSHQTGGDTRSLLRGTVGSILDRAFISRGAVQQRSGSGAAAAGGSVSVVGVVRAESGVTSALAEEVLAESADTTVHLKQRDPYAKVHGLDPELAFDHPRMADFPPHLSSAGGLVHRGSGGGALQETDALFHATLESMGAAMRLEFARREQAYQAMESASAIGIKLEEEEPLAYSEVIAGKVAQSIVDYASSAGTCDAEQAFMVGLQALATMHVEEDGLVTPTADVSILREIEAMATLVREDAVLKRWVCDRLWEAEAGSVTEAARGTVDELRRKL